MAEFRIYECGCNTPARKFCATAQAIQDALKEKNGGRQPRTEAELDPELSAQWKAHFKNQPAPQRGFACTHEEMGMRRRK